MQRTASVTFGALAVFALLSGCWRSTQPVTPSPPATTRTTPEVPSKPEESYRHVTLAVDAIGIGLIAASTTAYSQRGGDDPLAVGLLLVGGLTATFGTPIIHAKHGHGARAGASYLFRSMFVTAGMVAWTTTPHPGPSYLNAS